MECWPLFLFSFPLWIWSRLKLLHCILQRTVWTFLVTKSLVCTECCDFRRSKFFCSCISVKGVTICFYNALIFDKLQDRQGHWFHKSKWKLLLLLLAFWRNTDIWLLSWTIYYCQTESNRMPLTMGRCSATWNTIQQHHFHIPLCISLSYRPVISSRPQPWGSRTSFGSTRSMGLCFVQAVTGVVRSLSPGD